MAAARWPGWRSSARSRSPSPTTARTRSRLETTARRDGDTWVINGAEEVDRQRHHRRRRRACGPGTSPTARSRASWSRRAPPATTPGSSRARGRCGRSGRPRSRSTDVRVPEANRLPGAQSFTDTARVLAGTRGRVAWAALGHATAAYDAAADLREAADAVRQAAGQLPDRPAAAGPDARRGLLDAAVLPAAGPARGGGQGSTDTIAALAKMNNTRKARRSSPRPATCSAATGSCSTTTSSGTWPTSRPCTPIEGTETMQTLIVGRDITGISAFR